MSIILNFIKKYNILILIILGFLLYYPSLFYNILGYDDIPYIINNQYLNGRVSLSFFDFFIPAFVRDDIYIPITFIIYWSIIKIFGVSSFAFHFVNIFFYILSSIALYFLLNKIINNKEITFFAVFLYILHPCHIECTVWISAMGYNISAFFSFLSFIFFILAFDENKKLNYVYSIIFYILAILSQPIAVTLPAILFLWVYCFRKEKLKEVIIPIFSYIPFLLIYLYLYRLTVFSSRFDNLFEYNLLQKISFLGEYLFNSFIPIHLCPIQPLPNFYSIIYLFLFMLFLYFFKENKKFLFFCLFEIISILPYSNIFFPLAIPVADRYLLLSSLSSCVFISYLSFYALDKFKNKKILRYIFFPFFIILYLGNFLFYLPVWKNDVFLWNYSYKVNPNDVNIKKMYSKLLLFEEKYDEAINLANEIIKEKPNLLEGYEIKIKALVGKCLFKDALNICFLSEKFVVEKYKIYLYCFDIYVALQEFDRLQEYYYKAKENYDKFYKFERHCINDEVSLFARRRIILSYLNIEPIEYIENLKVLSNDFKLMQDNGEFLKILEQTDYTSKEKICLDYLKNYNNTNYSQFVIQLLSCLYMKESYKENASDIMKSLLKDMNKAQEFIIKGDNDSAEQLYLSVISKNKYMSQAYYNLGILYLQTNRKEKAKEIFVKMLNINSNDEQIKQLLNGLISE